MTRIGTLFIAPTSLIAFGAQTISSEQEVRCDHQHNFAFFLLLLPSGTSRAVIADRLTSIGRQCRSGKGGGER
jgi:hypothetical protein